MKITIRFDNNHQQQGGATTTKGTRKSRASVGGGGERKLPGRDSKKRMVSYVDQTSEEEDEQSEEVEYEEVQEQEVEEDEDGEESSLSDLEEKPTVAKKPSGNQARSRLSVSTQPPRSTTTVPTQSSNTRRRSSTTTVPAQNAAVVSAKPLRPRRIRLENSFFQSASLRDSFFPQPNLPSTSSTSTTSAGASKKKANQNIARRRSSSRVVYAFGHRLPPDSILLKQFDFEPHGGGYVSSTSYASSSSDETSEEDDSDEEDEKKKKRGRDEEGRKIPPKGFGRKDVEELVKERLEARGEGEGYVFLGGRIFAKSAVDAWRVDPVRNDGKIAVNIGSGTAGAVEATAAKGHVVKEQEGVRSEPPRMKNSPAPSATVSKPPATKSRPSLSKPVPSAAGGGGSSGLGFALPSVAQVLFASVPKVKSTEEDEMDVDG